MVYLENKAVGGWTVGLEIFTFLTCLLRHLPQLIISYYLSGTSEVQVV